MCMTSQDVSGSLFNCIMLGDNLVKAWRCIFVLEMDWGSSFTLEGISAIACITDIRLENISCFGSAILIS